MTKFAIHFALSTVLISFAALGDTNSRKPSAPAPGTKASKALNPVVTGVQYDRQEKGTRVNLKFALLDDKNMPINFLRPGRNGQFRVFLDGVEETSFETLTDASHLAPTVGITLVLDTSLSMQDQDALKSMRKAAEHFVAQLSSSNQKFRFTYYQFATDVQKIAGLSQINTEKAFGRFTSLYSALKIAIQENPNDIILLFTDGADNKSIDNDQARVQSITEIEELIKPKKTVVHTVKLGIDDSNDMQGVPNRQVLQRISVNGSVRYSEQPDEIIRAFESVAAKIPSPYFFSYLCPRTSVGSYRLGVEIDADGVASDRSRWTTDVKFELPFEIGSRAPLVTPFTDAWYPILKPEFNNFGQLSGSWNLFGFSPIAGHPNGGLVTPLGSDRVGSVIAEFDSLEVSNDKQSARIAYILRGPESEIRDLAARSQQSAEVIDLRALFIQTGFNGNYEWDSLASGSIRLGTVTLQNGQAKVRGERTIYFGTRKPFMTNFMAMVGEYVDSQGQLRVFSVSENSLRKVD